MPRTRILSAIRGWLNQRRDTRDLRLLKDRDLADIGLSRSEIAALGRSSSFERDWL